MNAAPSAIPVARPRQPGKRDYLSWSAISAYRTCPLRFYFRYVAELPEETVSASLVFGAAIHRAVEHHFRELLCGAPAPSLSELVDHYQAEWNERDAGKVRFTGRELRPALDATAHRLLAKFQESDVAEETLEKRQEILGPDHHQRFAVPSQHDVARLEIAVQHAAAVEEELRGKLRWLLVRRECGVPDEQGGANR